MSALLTAVVAFLAFAIAHLVVWRLRRPRAEYATLGGLWLAVLVVALTAAYRVLLWANLPPLAGVDHVNVLMLYTALALPYVTTYSAVQADSPAMSVLLRIDGAGRVGVTRDELRQDMNDQRLVVPRLEDLFQAGLARRDGERCVIGPRGALMAAVHTRFRALLRMEKGG